jgi:hypothetical protein
MVGCDSVRLLSRRIRCGVALCQLAEKASFRVNLPLENCSEKLVVSENSPLNPPQRNLEQYASSSMKKSYPGQSI